MTTAMPGRLLKLARAAQRMPPLRTSHGAGFFSFPLPGNLLMECRTHGLETRGCDRYFTLIINLATDGKVVVDETPFTLRPGHALLLFPFQHYQTGAFAAESITWLFFTFETENMEPLMPLHGKPVLVPEAAIEFLERLCLAGPAEAGITLNFNRQVLDLSLVLLELVAAARKDGVPFSAERANTLLRQDILHKVGKYISWHMGSLMRIDEVARSVGVSGSHLRALFRQQVHISLGRFIRRSKVIHAGYLLKNTDLNLTQISEKCGLGSLYAFGRTFKREMKITPLDYRRRLRPGPGHDRQHNPKQAARPSGDSPQRHGE